MPAPAPARDPRSSARGAARLAVLAAALVWGASFTIVQAALRDLGVFHLLTLRFALAVVLLWPLARREAPGPGVRPFRDAGAALVGLALFVGFALQTAGLRYTTPAKSAFVTGLSVVLVPIFGWAFGSGRPRLGPALGTLFALAGLYALYSPLAGASAALNLGDALTLAGAISFAGHVLLVERHVHRIGVRRLALVQFAIVAALSAPSLLLVPPSAGELTPRAWVAIAVTAVFSTVVAFLCQLYAQRHLSASETVMWLTLEPLFAATISIAVGAEAFGMALVAGGALILVGMLLSQLGAAVPEPSLAEHGGDPHPLA